MPESIKKNEILPNLARGNIGVLERQNLRVSYRGRDINPATVDWTKADMRKFHVYQPPGASNALGIVKFRFPNKHDVYMHDTPSKSLFNATVRAFSHGCMRVRDPLKLAELVLAEDRGWTASRVTAAVRSGPKDNQINLTAKVPVHMTYFTAWVDDDGTSEAFGDIYGHESRIALGIAGKSHLIKQERPEQRLRPRASSGRATVADGFNQRPHAPRLDARRIPVLTPRSFAVSLSKALLRVAIFLGPRRRPPRYCRISSVQSAFRHC